MAILRASLPSVRRRTPLPIRAAVVAALAGTGLVHLLLASTYGRGSVVVGASFVVGGLTAFVAGAWLLATDANRSWDLAAAVSGGMLVGLLLSSTVGLFGIRTSALGTPELVSVVTEVSVLIAWAVTRLRRR